MPHSTQYRSFRRRSSQPISWLVLANKTVQENTDKQTQYKSEKVNNLKYSRTKLPWFSCLLQHSARKRGGFILQRSRAHTMRQLKVRQDHTELDIDLAVSLVRNVRALELDDSKSFFYDSLVCKLRRREEQVKCECCEWFVNVQGELKRGHRLMTIILSHLNRLKTIFTRKFLGEFVVKWILQLSPHIIHVATLPCETLMLAKQAITR